MTDLVTGGCGFMGRHIVQALLRRNRKVRVLDIDCSENYFSGVELSEGSVTDTRLVREAMQGVERVFHVAGIAHLWTRDKEDFARVNHIGTRTMLQEAQRCGVERFIHTSSGAVVFPSVEGGAEPDLRGIPGPYFRSKFHAEREVLAAAAAGQPALVVCPTLPIGPGDPHLTPPTRMILDFVNLEVPAYLDFVVNLIDVRDVAAGHLAAAERGTIGRRYVLSNETLNIARLIRMLHEITGLSMPRFRVPYPLAYMVAAVSELVADRVTHRAPKASLAGVRATRLRPETGSALSELGVAPTPVRQSLADGIAWLDEQGLIRRPVRPRP